MRKGGLKFGTHFIQLFLLTGYVSSQLHELGHWLAASFLNADIALGFNRWKVLSPLGEEAAMLVLAAGPVVSLLLASLGIALLHFLRKPFPRAMGVSLATSNPLIMIASVALGSLTGASYDFTSSEHPWKLFLLPVFAVLLLFGLKPLGENLARRVRRGLVLLLLSVGVGLLILVIDEMLVWPGIEGGNPVFAPVLGISGPVILVNTPVFAGLALVCKRGLAGPWNCVA